LYEIGLISKYSDINTGLNYSLLNNEFIDPNHNYTIYQGPFSDPFNNIFTTNIILPSSIHVENNLIYMNLEGRLRETVICLASNQSMYND
jgi:hypothetical protein